MTTPYIETYSQDPSGMGYGDYTRVPTRLAKYRVEHSMLQGDQMTFETLTNKIDNELVTRRPIRFYTEDDTKLFDGIITQVSYETMGDGYKKLTGIASGWWQELKSMELLKPLSFEDKSPDFMFSELCNIANQFGMRKRAQYTYDTDKIPYYSLFDDTYQGDSGVTFEFTNVYQAMLDIVAYMDVAETYSPYDVGLRIESLPAASGDSWEISENESNLNIHVLPFVLREDGNEKAVYRTFKLESGLNIIKDYRQHCNSCIAIGEGFHTQQIRTTKPLNDIVLTSNPETLSYDNQVVGNHYLVISVDNQTAVDKYGWIEVMCVDGTTNPVEVINARVPAEKTLTMYTSDRTCDGLANSNTFKFTGLVDCEVSVAEVTNDDSPHFTTIAGRSINDTGYAPKRVESVWANTQHRVDALAGKMVRLYHNPVLRVDIPILSKYGSYDNVIGKPVDVYSQFRESEQAFLSLSTSWVFEGELVVQRMSGIQHQVVWDGEMAYYDVIDGSSNNVVTNTGKQVIAYDD